MILFFLFEAALLGLILGSFINALAYRIPRKESITTRSHCTTCDKQIYWYENIPLFSWLFLRGRCSGCKERISARYPIVEASTSIIFVALTWKAFQLFPDAPLLAALVFVSFAFVAILLALIDLDTRKLPTSVIKWGALVVVTFAVITSLILGDWGSLLRGAIVAFVFWLIYFILWFWKPGAMGLGDVRYSLLLGFVTGWVSVGTALLAFFLPSVLAVLFMLPSLLKKEKNTKTAIPFGPWLSAGTLLAILLGDIVMDSYLRLGA